MRKEKEKKEITPLREKVVSDYNHDDSKVMTGRVVTLVSGRQVKREYWIWDIE